MTKAARQLRVKIPTAKVILSNYRKKGHIYTKKSDKTVSTEPIEATLPSIKEENIDSENISVHQ